MVEWPYGRELGLTQKVLTQRVVLGGHPEADKPHDRREAAPQPLEVSCTAQQSREKLAETRPLAFLHVAQQFDKLVIMLTRPADVPKMAKPGERDALKEIMRSIAVLFAV